MERLPRYLQPTRPHVRGEFLVVLAKVGNQARSPLEDHLAHKKFLALYMMRDKRTELKESVNIPDATDCPEHGQEHGNFPGRSGNGREFQRGEIPVRQS
jgi:hypothetical protein